MDIRNRCFQIYQRSFPDSPAYINMLFDLYFDAGCRFLIENGEVVSMLFLLDCTVVFGEEFPAAYLYAAATHPDHRGRGYMSRLIEQVKKESDRPLYLKAADKGLTSFYQRLGFYGICGITEAEGVAAKQAMTVVSVDAPAYHRLRDKFLKDAYVRLDERFLSLALNECKAVTDHESYVALYEISDHAVHIKELVGNTLAAGSIALCEGKSKYTVRLSDPNAEPFALGWGLDPAIYVGPVLD